MIEMLYLFLTFLKIGVVSFGGGYGMISVLTEEVLSHGWLTETELMNFIAVSESTPGPIAINMATFVGASQGQAVFGSGFGALLGAFLATFGVVLPAFLIILVIASLIKGLLKFKCVEAFLQGVRPVVMGLVVGTGLLLFSTVIIGYNKVYNTFDFDYKSLIIFGVVVLIYFIYKVFKKKSISPIILILSSAVLGIFMYGVI